MSISKPLKTLPNRKPLYIEMAQRVEKQDKESLEEKKKRLEEIRAFHQPLKKEEMMDHAMKYEKIRQDKEHDIRQKRKAEILAERERKERLPTFSQSRTSQDVLDSLRKPGQILGAEQEKLEAAKARKLNQEKIANYGKYVKEMYWPQVSEKNQM